MQVDSVQLNNSIIHKPLTKSLEQNTSIVSNSLNKTENTEHNVKKLNNKTKIAIAVGAFAAMAGIFALVKKNSAGNLFNKNPKVANNPVNAANSPIKDKLGYEIQQPKVGDAVVEDGDSLYKKYNEIKEFTLSDENTKKRFEEVQISIQNDYKKLQEEIKKSANIEINDMGDDIAQNVICKKRYFSMPEHSQEGYSNLDPLLYQKSREESVDLVAGYGILEELNTSSESTVLNALRSCFASKISDKDSEFLDECVSKLSGDNVCYGKNSALHTFELSNVGKIFREAMGIKVQ